MPSLTTCGEEYPDYGSQLVASTERHAMIVDKVTKALNPYIQQPNPSMKDLMEDESKSEEDSKDEEESNDDIMLDQFQQDVKLEAIALRGQPQ